MSSYKPWMARVIAVRDEIEADETEVRKEFRTKQNAVVLTLTLAAAQLETLAGLDRVLSESEDKKEE